MCNCRWNERKSGQIFVWKYNRQNEKKRKEKTKKKKKEEWTGDVSEQKASGVKMVLFNGGVT